MGTGVNKVADTAIGAAIDRIEDLRFLRGRGIYVGDLQRADGGHNVSGSKAVVAVIPA
jgi:hypothetical protein